MNKFYGGRSDGVTLGKLNLADLSRAEDSQVGSRSMRGEVHLQAVANFQRRPLNNGHGPNVHTLVE